MLLGTSSFPARYEVYGKTTEKFVPSWERARTQNDYKYDLRFPSKWRHYSILNELIWLVNKLNLLWLQNSHEFVEICNKICSCQNRFRLLLLAGIQIWFWKTFKFHNNILEIGTCIIGFTTHKNGIIIFLYFFFLDYICIS